MPKRLGLAQSMVSGIGDFSGLLGKPKPPLTMEQLAARAHDDREYESKRCGVCGCHPAEHGADYE